LASAISQLGAPLKIKLFGFGLAVEGSEEDVWKAVELSWSLDGEHVLVKPRGFAVMDERFTNSLYRGWGTMRRKGLLQLDFELELAENLVESTSTTKRRAKIVECKYVRGYVTALVIEENGEKLVYCPEMRAMGDHACIGRCPYGKVMIWA